MDKPALDHWLNILNGAIEQSGDSGRYSSLQSGADRLRGLSSGSDGSAGTGGSSGSNGSAGSGGSSGSIGSNSSAGASQPSVTSAVTTGSSYTSTGTATSTSKPRGLPFQPRESDSRGIVLGLSSLFIFLFF